MRIVQINGGAKGSTGKIMMGIAEVARAQGHEVMCASPITTTNRDAGKNCGYYRIGTFFSRRVSVALARLTGFNGCFAWVTTLRFLKRIDAFKPDILHLHNLHDSYINLPMLFGYIKKRNLSVVWTLHDCWAFTGQCPYFTIAKCDKWKTGCHDCPQYRAYPASYYDNTKTMWRLKQKWFCGVENLTIVTPSRWLAELVKESFLKEYPVHVINNGIDLRVFRPTPSDFRRRYGISPEKHIVLGVSFAWGVRKGLDCFVALASRLDERYQIVLVGTDEQIDRQLPPSIISIHRTQDQKELAEIYTAADVFVNPTREENYPTVNMEAIACGTPVITFNTGGSPEMLDEKTGVVVPVDDIAAMEKVIERICLQGQSKEKLYLSERAGAFSEKNSVAGYVNLYTEVVGIE